MIQRIQTVFLLLAVLCFLLPVFMSTGSLVTDGFVTGRIAGFTFTDAHGHVSLAAWPLPVLMYAASVVAVGAVFVYKRRKLQARMCLVAIVAALAWYVALLLLSRSLGGDASQFEPSLAVCLPAAGIVLTFMARRAILADERLVRSLDRLR